MPAGLLGLDGFGGFTEVILGMFVCFCLSLRHGEILALEVGIVLIAIGRYRTIKDQDTSRCRYRSPITNTFHRCEQQGELALYSAYLGDSSGVNATSGLTNPKEVRRTTYDFFAAHQTRTIVSVDETSQLAIGLPKR